MATDPNMRCVCGYRIFREGVSTKEENVARWLRFTGGFGATPFGTYFGSGGSGTWGEFSVPTKVTRKRVVCESCQRVRSDTTLAVTGVFGSYVFGGTLYIYITDTSLLSCLKVQFSDPDLGTYTLSPVKFAGTPLPLAATAPNAVAPAPPPNALLAGVLQVPLPEVDQDGDYLVSLVDVCAGVETPIAIFPLEASVQSFVPADADLNGLPRLLIDANLTADLTLAQPGSGSITGIPFDRCTGVIEYDARFGTGPTAQGWTQTAGAAGNYGLTAGGVLNAVTTGPSYFEQTLSLPNPATAVHGYAKYRVQSTTSIGSGVGLELRGEAAPGGAANYEGARVYQDASALYARTLDDSADAGIDIQPQSPWSEAYFGLQFGTSEGFVFFKNLSGVPASTWGTRPGGPASPELHAVLGDYAGSGLTGQIRNFVVSASGRFVRAMFRSYAPAASAVLRLSFVSDLGLNNSARIKVRYGSLAFGADPYTLGAVSVGTTAFFNTKNVVVEVPLTLTNLPAKSPFWFSVERDWQHPDDTTAATIHFLTATVRTS